jgi:translocation and assembly module TamB
MRLSMKATRKILVGSAIALLALAGLAVLLLALGLGLANTPWGRHAIESATARWTGGQVLVVGLAGQFPDDLRAARLEVRDDQGSWASAQEIHVQWSPAQLLHNAIHLDLIQAASVQIARAPLPRASAQERSAGDLVRLDIGRIELARVAIGSPARPPTCRCKAPCASTGRCRAPSTCACCAPTRPAPTQSKGGSTRPRCRPTSSSRSQRMV